MIDVEFKSATYDVPEDFVYEKIGYTYRDVEISEDGISPYLVIPAVFVLCVTAFGVVCLVAKKRKGKEEHTDAE